jgi:hypothetical protein
MGFFDSKLPIHQTRFSERGPRSITRSAAAPCQTGECVQTPAVTTDGGRLHHRALDSRRGTANDIWKKFSLGILSS